MSADGTGKQKLVGGVSSSDSNRGLYQEFTSGAAHVADVGVSGQSQNRVIATGGSTLPTDIATATWGEGTGIHYVSFKITGGTAGHRVRVVFNASPVDDSSDTTQASNWLTSVSSSGSIDVEYTEIAQGGGSGGAGEWSDLFQFTEELRRIDVISVDADVAQTIFVEAR